MSARPWWKAAPDGLVAAVLLSFLATAGLFYVNIMAALVDGLERGLHFSARDAGFVASANVYGAAVGALCAVFTVKIAPWRKVAIACLLGMIAVDLVSTQLKLPAVLIGVRFAHGLIGGFLVGNSYAVFARTRAPDRVFGMLLVVQFGLGGLGLLVLPRLVPIWGTPVLFLTLVAFNLVTLAMLPFLDSYAREPEPAVRTGGARTAWPPLFAALFALFLFQSANQGVAAYVIGLGRTFGLSTAAISSTVGVSNWLGAVGSLMVVGIGIRFGRSRPILAGMILLVVGTALFLITSAPVFYVVANVATAVAWSFTVAYLLGLCAAFDRAGRGAALAGFSSKMGLASGPALGGVLLEETHFPRLVLLALAGLALSLVASAWPAARLDRAKPG